MEFVFALMVYLLPTFVAFVRGHASKVGYPVG